VVMDRVELSSPQFVEANWLSELGSWTEHDGFHSCGGRLGVAVLGRQPVTAARQEINVRSSFKSQRLQTRFDAPAGESLLIHVFWDEQAGFQPEALTADSLSMQLGKQSSAIR